MQAIIEALRSSLSAAAPVLLAALGGLYTYYSGVFNIAMEGMMLMGAFAAVVGSWATGSWLVGLAAGVLLGLAAAAIFAFFAVRLKTDEFVTGIAVNMLALGGTTYALRQVFHVKGAFISTKTVGLPVWRIPFIDGIPVVGEVLSGHPFLVYVAIALVFAVSYHIFGTRFGLRLRASGEDAAALDSVGVDADALKVRSILVSGALCGLAGVYLSLGYVRLFAENMSNGRGWISLTAIILTKGRPVSILLLAILFGLFDGLGLSLQNTAIPSQFTQMLPYLATLVALFFYSRKRGKGKHDGKSLEA